MEEKHNSFKLTTNPGDIHNTSAVKGILFLTLLGAVVWYFYGGGLQKDTNNTMQNITDQVAVDSVNQYNIAVKSGDRISICVQAGLVSAAYLQAQDEPNYLQWKEIEKNDCKKAGL